MCAWEGIGSRGFPLLALVPGVGEYILARVEIEVCLVYFSIFAGESGHVLAYARTHTQTTWALDVSPGVGRIPGEPENPDRLKRSIHVDRVGVHSTFVYIYAVLRVLMIWANCFFLSTCLFF